MLRAFGVTGLFFLTISCGGRVRFDTDAAGAGGAAPVPLAGAAGSVIPIAGAAAIGGSPSAGTGGAPEDPSCSVGHGCAIAMGDNVRELRANTTHLFWLASGESEPGSQDVRLYRADLATGHAMLVSGAVYEAAHVGVTETHVLISARERLVRFTSSGDSSESIPIAGYVSPGWQGWVASSGSTAFFATSAGIYRLRADETSAVALTEDYEAGSMVAVGADLYFEAKHKGDDSSWYELYRVPGAGGSMQLVAKTLLHGLQSSGSFLYGFDCALVGPDCVWRMPITGGEKQAVPSLEAGAGRVMISGTAIYIEAASGGIRTGVARQSLDQPGLTRWRIDDPALFPVDDQRWVGTAQGLFWTNGTIIYRRTDPR